jgi:hypothetical protein
MKCNTRDLMDFSRRELHMAGNLLRLFRSDKDHTVMLGDTVTPEFNPESGLVFLIDDSFNIAMANGPKLEDWLRCPQCGREGFKEKLEAKDTPQCCKDYIKKEFY